MPQSVGGDVLLDAGLLRVGLQDGPDPLAGQAFTPVVNEQRRLGAAVAQERDTDGFQLAPELFQGFGVQVDDSLFRALAHAPYVGFRQVHVLQVQ